MENLDRAKEIMVDILIEIDRICVKHNIIYWIDFGTLLGAVRHKGFIPWDDDIDISMPREEYNKFIKIAQKELKSEYLIQHKTTTPNSYILAMKVRDRKSIYVEYGNEGKEPNGENGIFVDIFPMERISKKSLKKVNFLRKLYHINPFKPKYQSKKTKFLNYAFSFIYPFRNIFKYLIKKTYSSNGDIIVCGHEVPFSTSYPYKLVFPIKKIDFENHLFNCPQQEKAILKSLFGDFMKLPPKHLRKIHATEIKIFE